jgi:hypothetical protein
MVPAGRIHRGLEVHLVVNDICNQLEVGLDLILGTSGSPKHKQVILSPNHIGVQRMNWPFSTLKNIWAVWV